MEREDAQGAQPEPEPARKQDRRRLPPELTGLLPRKLEHCLDHVVRRRILRAMHREQREFSSAQLCHERGPLSDLPLSAVAYHMSALADCEMVREVLTAPNRGALEPSYISTVETEPLVLSILAQTEELDSPKRDSGGEG